MQNPIHLMSFLCVSPYNQIGASVLIPLRCTIYIYIQFFFLLNCVLDYISIILQIIQGQLQMHKIHPQNILLSGNIPGIQGGHIIINPAHLASQVVIAADQSNIQHATSTTTASPPENIIIVPSGGTSEVQPGAVQMIYNTPTGLVYASHGSILNQNSQTVATSGTETVTIHHQPNSNPTTSGYHIQETSKPGTPLQTS